MIEIQPITDSNARGDNMIMGKDFKAYQREDSGLKSAFRCYRGGVRILARVKNCGFR